MWKKLGDLSAGRNFWESFLFYIVYGAAGVFLCGVITSIITDASSISDAEQIKLLAFRVAPVVAGVYTFFVAGCLIHFKHLGKDALAWLCAVVGSFASMSLGLIFGFVPVAILSSIDIQNNITENDSNIDVIYERN